MGGCWGSYGQLGSHRSAQGWLGGGHGHQRGRRGREGWQGWVGWLSGHHYQWLDCYSHGWLAWPSRLGGSPQALQLTPHWWASGLPHHLGMLPKVAASHPQLHLLCCNLLLLKPLCQLFISLWGQQLPSGHLPPGLCTGGWPQPCHLNTLAREPKPGPYSHSLLQHRHLSRRQPTD